MEDVEGGGGYYIHTCESLTINLCISNSTMPGRSPSTPLFLISFFVILYQVVIKSLGCYSMITPKKKKTNLRRVNFIGHAGYDDNAGRLAFSRRYDTTESARERERQASNLQERTHARNKNFAQKCAMGRGGGGSTSTDALF